MQVLVVEDDDRIGAPLEKGLLREGFDVERVTSGAAALGRFTGGDAHPDVVLLDLRLPDLDGFEVCREIRTLSDVPVIIVSARSEEVDRVLGLGLGADDYVVKPFGFRELVARIHAVTRRSQPRAHESERSCLGPLVIDRRTHRVTIGEAEIALTPKEFDLLAFLAEDPDAVVKKEQILEGVWDPHWYGPTKTLDVHIATLRKKLGHPEWIETVRGVGFRLRVAEADGA